jgi:hypothetical protein
MLRTYGQSMELKDKVHEMISDFDFEKQVSRQDRSPLTIWVRPEERLKYDILQAKSCRRFSKLVQSVVREAIRQAETNQSS